MLALQFIRDHPDVVKEGAARKCQDAPIDEILDLDRRRRNLLQETESLRADRKRLSAEIGRARSHSSSAELISRTRELSQRLQELEPDIRAIDGRLSELLLLVPNVPHQSVPFGRGEDENVVVRQWGEARSFSFEPRPHWELGEFLGIIDFERGVKLSGSRFHVLRGMGARVARTLITFMIDVHTSEHRYTEVYPPFLVKRECMVGTGQLPKFAEDSYLVDEEDLFLVPTAEVPVTNLHRDEILEPGVLPLYYVAYTPCFRREAGAAGKETRGLIRVHQFDKVELVKFVEPHTSYDELEGLVSNAEAILQKLGLHYRVKEMCTGDLGFAQTKKYDPEVWMAGERRYVEVSSCSNFEDFQARRANIRYRPSQGSHAQYVHTLNGSGLAIGRTLAAILESYQLPDGSVAIPEVLQPYVGGATLITRSQ